MFRCPSCAVVWSIPLTKGHILLAGYDINTWTIEKTPVSFFSKVDDVEDLSDLADKLKKHNLDFVDSDNIKCDRCNEVHSFQEWNNAWDHPMELFDADQLCKCGGELWWDRHPYQPVYALVCEKCSWVKPKAKLSGAE